MTRSDPPGLLLVHAHPDDESLTTGGTIARYAAEGVPVTLVTCTLGEEGEIIPPPLRRLAATDADQLGGYRSGELAAACAALGVTDHHYLGGIGRWRDSGMVGTAANAHPRALVRGRLSEQVDALSDILDAARPAVVVTYGPDGGYGHPDHIRAHEITMAACVDLPFVRRIFHVVVSRSAVAAGVTALSTVEGLPFRLPADGELSVVDDTRITTVVPIGEYVPAKVAALRAHATQIGVWPANGDAVSYALTNGIAQPILDAEFFTLALGDAAGAGADLFGGLGAAGPAPGAAP